MKTFIITSNLKIECERKNGKRGFIHSAVLYRNETPIAYAKIHYANRTWESFEFETVIKELIERNGLLTPNEKKLAMKKLEEWKKEPLEAFQVLNFAMKIGDVMYKTDQKKKNEWKIKMLKAALGERLITPEEWEKLDENEKEKRLKRIEKLLDEKT